MKTTMKLRKSDPYGGSNMYLMGHPSDKDFLIEKILTPSYDQDAPCRDPFRILDYDTALQLLSYFAPGDFQQLRRVSKTWKDVIELNIGRKYLLKDFPDTPLPPRIKIDEGVSRHARQEADDQYQIACNLEYRRTHFHRFSFRNGMASRAYNLIHTQDWHLNNHRLVTTDAYYILVRSVRDISKSEIQCYRTHRSFLKKKDILYVQITREGDLFVVYGAEKPSHDEMASYTDYSIIKFTTEKATPRVIPGFGSKAGRMTHYYLENESVAAHYEFKNCVISKPAMGEKSLYFVRSDKVDPPEADTENSTSAQPSARPFFTKVDLATGSIVFNTPIPEGLKLGVQQPDKQVFDKPTDPDTPENTSEVHRISVSDQDTSLRLFKDEKAAMWIDNDDRVFIFSTTTGNVIYSFDKFDSVKVMVDTQASGAWFTDFNVFEDDNGADPPLTFWIPMSFDDPSTPIKFGKPICSPYSPEVHNVHGQLMALAISKGAEASEHEKGHVNHEISKKLLVAFSLEPFKIKNVVTEADPEPIPLTMDLQQIFEEAGTLLEDVKEVYDYDPDYKDPIAITGPCSNKSTRRRLPIVATHTPGAREEEETKVIDGYLTHWNPENEQLLVFNFFPEW